jgi:hypothetical protein
MLSDTRSESAPSFMTGSVIHDDRSIFSVSKASPLELTVDDASWSIDMQTFDESAETAAILDSSGTNPQYIRLLVKTITALACEEDAQRLLFDRLPNRFCEFYLVQQRSIVRQQLNQYSKDISSTDNELSTQSRILSRYITYLLENVIGVMKRLSFVVKMLSNSIGLRTGGSTIVDPGTAAIMIGLWDEIEDMITSEIRLHLVESDIEKISDQISTRVSIQQLDEDGIIEDGHQLLVRPSSHHAPALFRRVVDYNASSVVVLKDIFGIASHQELARPLMGFMHQFLESEFVPLIQSTANEEIRDMALNTELYFAAQKSLEGEPANPCLAASRINLTAEVLFGHYRDLFQHREMIVVILDRLIRGFLSAARDHLETNLFSWPFLNTLSVKETLKLARDDPAFVLYHRALFNGKSSLDEYLGIASSDRNGSQSISDNNVSNSLVNELTSVWQERYWDVTNSNYVTDLNVVS